VKDSSIDNGLKIFHLSYTNFFSPSVVEFMQVHCTIESPLYKRTTRTPISTSYENKISSLVQL